MCNAAAKVSVMELLSFFQVAKLQRASLRNPVKVEVSTKYQTVDKLLQYYIFLPAKFKDVYLTYILNELAGNSFMVFCSTCAGTQRAALMLRNLGLMAVPLHGQMSQVGGEISFRSQLQTWSCFCGVCVFLHSSSAFQSKRLGALNKFKSKSRLILIATDVASR